MIFKVDLQSVGLISFDFHKDKEVLMDRYKYINTSVKKIQGVQIGLQLSSSISLLKESKRRECITPASLDPLNMATQKFSNFSIDYILGDASKQTAESPRLDHPASSQDFPGHLTTLDLLTQDGPRGHCDHAALMMNFPSSSSSSSSSSWAGMYSCCVPVSYYQPAFNSNYYAGQQWPCPFAISGMPF